MNKKNIYIIIGAVIIIAAGAWLAVSCGFLKSGAEKTAVVQEKLEKDVVLAISGGKIQPVTFKMNFIKGMTAFDLLKSGTDELDLSLKTKAYDIGIMVAAIGDTENGKDGKYWMYYVNGEMPMVSADKKELKAGDKVEFKFEKSTF
jgi:hypothetical protein